MENNNSNKMYLTAAEAKAKGLGTVQEQIDRYNAALPSRVEREAKPVEDLAACFERNIARVILGS